MGNLLACFGGQDKNSGSSRRRKPPPGKRRSLPSQPHPQQQQQLHNVVLGHHDANIEIAEPLPRKRTSPELKTADGDADHDSLVNKLEESGKQASLSRPCDDDAPSLVIPNQPSIGSPSSTQVAPSSSPKKKVTFDLNVLAYDHVPTEDEEDLEKPEQDEGEGARLVKEDQGCAESKQGDVGFPGNNNRYGNCAESDDDDDGLFCDIDEADDDDGCDDSDLEGDNDADAVGATHEEEESFDSYFSLQMDKGRLDSSSKKESNCDEAISMSSSQDSELTPVVLKRAAAAATARDRSKYINSVLNPVENITQWKDVKAGRKNSQVKLPRLEKENIHHSTGDNDLLEIPSSPEPKLHARSTSSPQKPLELPSPKWATTTTTKTTTAAAPSSPKQPVSVDTSLSSWLTPTHTTTTTAAAVKASSRCSNSSFSQETSYRSNTNSFTSLEDRPILGALTVDDIKRTKSASASPRKSPSRSPDETPIMGTVGSYWKHTDQEADSRFARAEPKGIPNSTSKYREDKRVNWHSSPFEVRLERALMNKDSPASVDHPLLLTPCVESS